jgi:light-regulated signal transduction histidine kinase (bacteriophytochrome)
MTTSKRKPDHLLGAFRRYHATDEFEGDGIGLATVQRLVARHDGLVWAEAEIEKGATFFFTFAAADA